MNYEEFLSGKRQLSGEYGFEPLWMPDFLFDFQKYLVEWAIRKGRAAIFADCVSGDTIISGPDGSAEIAELAREHRAMRVWALGSHGPVVAQASVPWINGADRLYRFCFASGRSITATMGHRFLTGGGWKRGDSLLIGECLAVSVPSRLASNVESYRVARREDAPHSLCRVQGFREHYLHGSRQDGGQSLSAKDIFRSLFPSQADAREQCRTMLRMDVPASRSGYIRHRPSAAHLATGRYEPQASNTAASVGFRPLSSGLTYIAENTRSSRQAREGITPGLRACEFPPSAKLQYVDGHDQAFLPCDSPFVDWDTVTAIQYIKTDVFYDMEVPSAENYLANGVWSHNCGLGKTPMQLVWAENIVRKTNGRVLLLTPLAVSHQTEREAVKFGVDAKRSGDGTLASKIVITNYERLPHFNPEDFAGVVCDESSILKSYSGATRKHVTRFMSKMQYRLLCTATAAPNDYIELGTSSEALGELTHSDMLVKFFKYLDDKGQKSELNAQEEAEKVIASDGDYYGKLAYRVAQTIGQWRLKHHAVIPFWRWVASWSRACRMPSDLGFDDGAFILPPLNERDHIIHPATAPAGKLFNLPAFGLSEERAERTRCLTERCEYVAGLVDHKRPAVVWCHANAEGDLLEEIIPDGAQVAGATEDDEKIELYEAFATGQLRVLVIKPKIGAWGLNWQHCNHVVTFASHSYEQYYQSVRRCWRFGQTRPVTLDVVATEGETRVLSNMRRKAERSTKMFETIIREMRNATGVTTTDTHTKKMELPTWL